MSWRLAARRLAISAFLVVHIGAVVAINLPDSALRRSIITPVAYYLVPVGLDQAWGMFAPNPVIHANRAEVITVDKDGISRTFAFPKMTDFNWWQAVPRVRHSKYASNLGMDTNKAIREFAVRHAIRQLAIPADRFPVEAELVYQIDETPQPGLPARDPMTPSVEVAIQSYRFPTWAEVQP